MTFLNIWHFFCYLLCEIISLSWNKSKHFLKITYMIAFFKTFFPRDHFPCDYYKCNKPNLTANPYIKHTCFVCLSSPNEPLSLRVNEMDYFLSTFLKPFTGKKSICMWLYSTGNPHPTSFYALQCLHLKHLFTNIKYFCLTRFGHEDVFGKRQLITTANFS